MAEKKELRILTVNGFHFVAGLEWYVFARKRHFMKDVKQIGKKDSLDVVAIRDVSDSIQAGYAAKTKRNIKGYFSLALSLVTTIQEEVWISVLPCDNDKKEFVIIAGNKGSVVPWTDKVIKSEEIEVEINNLKSRLTKGYSGDIKIFGPEIPECTDHITDVIVIDELLHKSKLQKKFFIWTIKRTELTLRPLTFGLTKKQIAFLALAVLVIFIIFLFWHRHQLQIEEQHKRDVAAAKAEQERINKEAKHKTALENMRHPWIEQPGVIGFLDKCRETMHQIDLSMVGWKPVEMDCGDKSLDEPGKFVVNILVNRPTGSAATIEEFKKYITDRYKVFVGFNYNEVAAASFALTPEVNANGDDPLDKIDNRVNSLVSVLQRNNINPRLKLLPKPAKKLDKNGEEIEPPDWSVVAFGFTTDIPVQNLFLKKDDFTGIRITSYTSKLNDSQTDNQLNYEVKGVIYGK